MPLLFLSNRQYASRFRRAYRELFIRAMEFDLKTVKTSDYEQIVRGSEAYGFPVEEIRGA